MRFAPKERMRILYLTGRENPLYNLHRSKVDGVVATEFFSSTSSLAKLTRRVIRRMPGDLIGIFFADWSRYAKEFDVILITGTMYSHAIAESLMRLGLGDKLVHWFWNPITPADRIEQLRAQGVPIYTFDPLDSLRYRIGLESTYYFSSLAPNDVVQAPRPILADVFFVGGDKGRLGYLIELQAQFNSKGLKTAFHIADTGQAGRLSRYPFAPRIPYSEVLVNIRNSHCLLDVVQQGQSGCTQRPMEALFHEKKLITNDATISEHDFYCPENVFILGRDDPAGIVDFVRSPYRQIDPAIRNRYDFKNWIVRISNAVKHSNVTSMARGRHTW